MLELAVDVRKFEIERFWSRSLFFWGFIAAAFVAYAQLYRKDSDSGIRFLIACFGMVCSVAWTLVNRGGKYWQEAWEKKLDSVEIDVLGAELFKHEEELRDTGFWGAARYSVSRLTIMLSDFTVLVWLALAMKAVPVRLAIAPGWSVVIVGLVTWFAIATLLIKGRSQPRVDNASARSK